VIELENVTKTFETGYTALRDVQLDVEPERFVALVGPSGCGKSTTLSLIAGLDAPTTGSVRVRGKRVDGITTSVGFLFQRDALLPWKTVRDNVQLPLSLRGIRGADAQARVAEWIGRVGLRGFEASYPYQLSGGMRKRVALAQTFVNHPRILLMDEPFSGLDAQTRQIMAGELLGLWESLGASVLFVTHDLEEAIALADRVVVLTARPATVKQEFTVDLPRPRSPREIRFHPRFVELHEEIWSALSDEVRIAYTRATTVS
jgi:NitT/TauT family transport system ATP-binding protein